MRVIGLMSGTSVDGIDAALVELDGSAAAVDWRLVAFETLPYPRDHRDEIHAAMAAADLAALTWLHARLGEWFAEAILAVCRTAGVAPADIDLIGSHGQTVWHQPPREGARGATLQLGCPATIAERTGIPVVSDFRSRDMAAGGEGAPLVPWADQLLFTGDRTRVLQNIGGMANLTRLPPAGSDDPVIAFDTGPGNALIDAAVELATGGDQPFDRDGEYARRGSIHQSLLAELLEHPYLRRPPPKSTGRETFGRAYVAALVERTTPVTHDDWANLIATLTAFTARTIADAIRRWAPPGPGGDVVVTGGGSLNPALVEMLTSALDPIAVRTGDVLGLRPEAKEAVAFALLAWAHVHHVPANLPEVTGAAGARVLGSLTPGGRRP